MMLQQAHERNDNNTIALLSVAFGPQFDSFLEMMFNQSRYNIMDYFDDACMTRFTPGQYQKMISEWKAWRDFY